MTLSISSDVLLSYIQARSGQNTTGSANGSGTTAKSSLPTAPWNAASSSTTGATSTAGDAASANAIVSSLLGGTKLINPAAAKLSVSTSNASANTDYQNLFALYKGLTSLQSLATAAASSTSSQLTQIQKAFADGLAQVQTFLTSGPFKEFQVGDGTVTARDQSTAGVPKETDTYITSLTATDASTEVAALQGDVQFSMNVQPLTGAATTVDFNLADMGDTPRTLGNVVSYLNDQLQAAGVDTRFATTLVAGPATTTASTTTTGSSKTATPVPAKVLALEVAGSSGETISLSAPTSTPAVYVGETSTTPGAATTAASAASMSSTTAAASASAASAAASLASATASQVVKLAPTGSDTTSSVWSDKLPAGATVQSTATAADGSVYVLANVTSAINGQAIQGAQDAALLKYDSAGNLVYTQTLGAAVSASGATLAVSADGTQVAVAGSVSGTLDPSDTAAAGSGVNQSFVSVYNAASGDELWSQSQQASANNQATAVAFGANNAVYVAGSTSAALAGATSVGGQDAYVQSYAATSATDPISGETTWTGALQSTQQFGTSGADGATGIVVNGSSVYVSSLENGDAVVRAFNAGSSGALTQTAEQNLGSLGGGGLAGIAIGAGGAVIVAGTTRDGTLSAGSVTSAYQGGESAFVAQLSSNLDPSGAESLAYYAGGQDTTATGLSVSGDGGVYITGQTATGGEDADGQVTEQGYAAQIDPATGQVGWSDTFAGVNGNAAPTSISVSDGGASALDALGLPQGTIDYTGSQTVVGNSSVRAGDELYVQVGSGPPVAVTVAADDTYATLATKIQRASGNRVTATASANTAGAKQITITPTSKNNTARVEIEAGPAGRNALAGLGLKAGLITNASTVAAPKNASSASGSTTAANSLKAAYTVNVPTTLSLSSASTIKAAQTQISTAVAELQTIYRDMTTPKSTTTSSSSASAGLVNYYNSQTSDYAAALERLTASTTTSSSTTPTTLGSLVASLL